MRSSSGGDTERAGPFGTQRPAGRRMIVVKMGIIGTGRIVDRVMTDMCNAERIELTAIASRSAERAKAAAEKYGIPRAYGSYEELAEDPDVELVYIATPHSCHMENAILMMEHGKHVLCEKAMAVNDAEVRAMISCARKNGVFLMEAMWTRFMPAMKKARDMAEKGLFRDIRHVCGNFSYPGKYDESDRVYAKETAGGALLDLGVYTLMGITGFLGWKPEKVTGYAVKAPNGVDMRMSVQMIYPSGATAQFFCGMDAEADQRMTVYGQDGYLEIPDFWHPVKLILHRPGGKTETFDFQPENEGHHYEFDHAAECIEKGMTESPLVPLEESLAVSGISTRLRREAGILYPMDL
ncbi:MAG: oxidoreductase [Clostridiales bacterium]|nr:oxidoreductase [Clostridiales bacterium]